MKKIRLLSLLLVLLMVVSPFIFASCKEDEPEVCAEGEHDWKNESNPKKRKILQDLTCSLPEIRERECKKCGLKEAYESEAPTGHRYNPVLKVDMQDATCTTNGHYVSHCMFYNVCGPDADKIEEIPNSALGHEFVNYVVGTDPYVATAKCVRCDVTSDKLQGIKLDMEGERSHLSYSVLTLYKGEYSVAAAGDYKTVGDNTYLNLVRPENFDGDTAFGVTVAPAVEKFVGETRFVIEADLYLGATTSDLIIFKAYKASFNQKMTFLTYDAARKVLASVAGDVYALSADDLAGSVKVGVAVNDMQQKYDIYINDKLAAAGVPYADTDYFSGILTEKFEISMASGDTASEVGIDNYLIYEGNKPAGFDDTVSDGSNTINQFGVISFDGEVFSYQLPVDSEGHTHAFELVETQAATCTQIGFKYSKCSCGGEEYTELAKKKGHKTLGNTVVVDPTCFDSGYLVKTCSVCQNKFAIETEGKIDHAYDDKAVYHEPTCKKDAYTEGNCKHCGMFYVTEHTGTRVDHQVTGNATVVKATCSQDGYSKGLCRFCSEDIIDQSTYVKAYGHYDYFNSEYTTVAASCDKDGYEEHTCLSCGETFRKNETNSLGHVLYSKLETRPSANGEGEDTVNITRCIRCDYKDEMVLSPDTGKLPTYEENLVTVPEANRIKNNRGDTWANSDSWRAQNKATGDSAFTLRNAKVEKKTSLDGAYMQITLNTVDSPDKTLNNGGWGHTYWDYGPASGMTTAKKNWVFEMDFRYPSGKKGVNFTVQAIKRDSGGTSGATGPLAVSVNSSAIKFDLNNLSIDIEADTWYRVAMSFDAKDSTVRYYFNGKIVGEVASTAFANGDPLDQVNYMRINFNNQTNASENQTIDVNNFFMYYADRPAYVTGVWQFEGDGSTDEAPVDTTGVDLTANPPAGVTFKTDAGFTDYINQFGGAGFVYKHNAKFSVFENALRIQSGPSITTYGSPGANQYDSHITTKSFAKQTDQTIHFKVKLMSQAANDALIQIRYYVTATKQIPILSLSYDATNNKALLKHGSDVVYSANIGEEVEVDFVNVGSETYYSLFINGEPVVENLNYSNNGNYEPESSITFKLFNVGSGAIEQDIRISDFDIFGKVVWPEGYTPPSALPQDQTFDGFKQTVLSFDETSNFNRFVTLGSASYAGNDYWTAVEGASYLALNKVPADHKNAGNAKIVQINAMGEEVTEGGEYVYHVGGFGDGLWSPVWRAFENVPTKLHDDGKYYYDFTSFEKIRINAFVRDTVGFKQFGIMFYGRNYATEAGKDSYFYIYANVKGTGWYTFEIDIPSGEGNSRGHKWDSIDRMNFTFNGWSFGPNANGTGCNVDGFDVYLHSVEVVNKTTAVGSGYEYTVDAPICDGGIHTLAEEPTANVAATCTTGGYTVTPCTKCPYKEVATTPALGHGELTKIDAESQPATCDKEGFEVYQCAVCEGKFAIGQEKLLHNFVKKDDATAEQGYLAATCEVGGRDVYVCNNPGCPTPNNCYVVDTAPKGHTWDGNEVVTEADCDNAKTTVGYCTVCEADKTWVEGTKLGHDLETITVETSCGTAGSVTVQCKRDDCDYVAPKCETVGCDHSSCGLSYDIPAPPHTKPAAYLVIPQGDGTIKYICTNCHQEVIEPDPNAAPAPTPAPAPSTPGEDEE